LWNGKVPWMLKVLHVTINSSKESLFIRVYGKERPGHSSSKNLILCSTEAWMFGMTWFSKVSFPLGIFGIVFSIISQLDKIHRYSTCTTH